MLLSFGVHLSLLLATVLLGSAGTNSQLLQTRCHIPAGRSPGAEADNGALRFQFSDIVNNQNTIIPNLKIDSHIYIVSTCRPYLYILSENIETPSPLLELAAEGIVGTNFQCADDKNISVSSVYGTIAKIVDKAGQLNEVIPIGWRSGNNIIIRLYFSSGLPTSNQANYRCRLTKIFTDFGNLNFTVTANISLTKVGCPIDRYGRTCSAQCFCQNGGQCHTFEGWCLCPEGTSGLYCEKRDKTCHIPAGHSLKAAADKDAVRFTFSPIENNQNSIIPNLIVADHFYQTVNTCKPVLYIVTQEIQTPDTVLLIAGRSIAGTAFYCPEWSDKPVGSVSGSVTKFLNELSVYPEVIPQQWRSKYNVIIKLNFTNGFPILTRAAYRCRLEKLTASINITVTAGFSMEKVGCPKNRWGTTCEKPCSCQNNGECHTFDGWCMCPAGTSGLYCERLRNATVPGVTTESTTETATKRLTKSPTSAKQTDSRSTEKSTPKSTQRATLDLEEQRTLKITTTTTTDSKSSSGRVALPGQQINTSVNTNSTPPYDMSSTRYETLSSKTILYDIPSTRYETLPSKTTSHDMSSTKYETIPSEATSRDMISTRYETLPSDTTSHDMSSTKYETLKSKTTSHDMSSTRYETLSPKTKQYDMSSGERELSSFSTSDVVVETTTIRNQTSTGKTDTSKTSGQQHMTAPRTALLLLLVRLIYSYLLSGDNF